MTARIKKPHDGFRWHCYQCDSWVRDLDREAEIHEIWSWITDEPQGRCNGKLTDKYEQACLFFTRFDALAEVVE